MVSFQNGTMKFDASFYENELNFEEFLNFVEQKYSNAVKPKSEKVKSILKIQCAIEIISNILDEIEELVKETFKIGFTLSTIQNAIDMINKELLLIFQEVKDFFQTMKHVEKYNSQTFDIVNSLSKEIVNFQKSHYLIPDYERAILKENIRREIPLLKKYLLDENVKENEDLLKEMVNNGLFGTSVLQILRLNNIFKYFNRLRSIHCEFSFILLQIYLKDNCPSSDQKIKSDVKEIPSAYLEELFNRCVELGQATCEKANICRKNYCKAYYQRKSLIDNYRKKQELQIKQLNNLQLILRVINDLNEKHDNLSGKLIKTTKLYKDVHDILEQSWPIVKADAAMYQAPNEQEINFSTKNILRGKSSPFSVSDRSFDKENFN